MIKIKKVFFLNLALIFFSTLTTYLIIELFIAPIFQVKLHLNALNLANNPDHRPYPNDINTPTNEDAIKSHRPSKDFNEEGFNIIFLGDSFIYGYPDYKYTIPYLFENSLRDKFPGEDIKIANFGWISSSPLLDLRLLEKIGEKYHPDIIVLGYDMSDPYDDIKFEMIIQRKNIYWFWDKIPLTIQVMQHYFGATYEKIHRFATKGKMPTRRFFHSEAPLEETAPYCETTVKYIKKIDAYAKKLGAKFILIILPRHYQYNAKESPKNWEAGEYRVLGPYSLELFRYFEMLSKKVDFPIYSLLKDFQETDVFPTCYEDDPHWNENGSEVATKGVVRILEPYLEHSFSLQTNKALGICT